MAQALNILIPAALLGYAAYLIVRMARRRGKSCTGCSCCPMAGGCHSKRKEDSSL